MVQSRLPSREEVFKSDFMQFRGALEGLLRRVRTASPTYEQRGWIRTALEAAADALRRGKPDTRALYGVLDHPPPNMDPNLLRYVRDLAVGAVGLPATPRENEAVRHELENVANAVLSGPASPAARSLQQRWQQLRRSVPRRAQP
jgi:hypothetical protein